MKLTPQEIETAIWKKVEKEVASRLETFRLKNDNSLSIEDTAKIRGSIAFAKEILEWAKPSPTITSD